MRIERVCQVAVKPDLLVCLQQKTCDEEPKDFLLAIERQPPPLTRSLRNFYLKMFFSPFPRSREPSLAHGHASLVQVHLLQQRIPNKDASRSTRSANALGKRQPIGLAKTDHEDQARLSGATASARASRSRAAAGASSLENILQKSILDD